MSILFEKHPLTISPALAPGQPREADEFDRPQNAADAVLTIGLINNMPDSALQATERQFIRLLEAAAGNNRVLLHCFSLPSIKRSQPAKSRVDRQYADIADLGHLKIDGLIVTGAEPNAATLPEEPFWPELAAIIDWAEANTRSTIWSCLAAHAAVLHFDGIERQRLNAKCSGVFDCAKTDDHWLTENVPSPLKVSHSRYNALRKNDLTARGYQVLTESQEAGVDMKSLSIAARDTHTDEHVVGYYNAGDRMKYWGKVGAFWGGFWGLLFGSAAFAIPGIGQILVAGPLVAWIIAGLEGAAVVGGVSAVGAGLVSIGVPKDSVLKYDVALKTDKFVLIVHGTPDEVTKAKDIIEGTEHTSYTVHGEAVLV